MNTRIFENRIHLKILGTVTKYFVLLGNNIERFKSLITPWVKLVKEHKISFHQS